IGNAGCVVSAAGPRKSTIRPERVSLKRTRMLRPVELSCAMPAYGAPFRSGLGKVSSYTGRSGWLMSVTWYACGAAKPAAARSGAMAAATLTPGQVHVLDGVAQRPLDVDEVVCELARPLEQRPVLAQLRELEIGQPRLSRSAQLPPAADLEVLFGELEPVGRAHERLQPPRRRLRQVLARARDQ